MKVLLNVQFSIGVQQKICDEDAGGQPNEYLNDFIVVRPLRDAYRTLAPCLFTPDLYRHLVGVHVHLPMTTHHQGLSI